jgi:hypothetical protein
MQTLLSDVLCTLENRTADAERDCFTDMSRTLASIRSREAAIAQLSEFVEGSNPVTEAELGRLGNIERSGSRLLQLLQEKQQQLRADLSSSSRQRSFTDRVTGVLNLQPASHSFDL